MRLRLAVLAAACALLGCGSGAATPPEADVRLVTFGHSFVEGRYPDPAVVPWPERVAGGLDVTLSNRGVGATESPAIAASVEAYDPRAGDVVLIEAALD